ncbi:MAG: hypothetical protein BWY49_00112 [Candidatus Omnitrophica bacterium ADurb.Bin314]|nr:MAG: hypothetical protein BWY49_00112 [Candidatus Omnitrophica bacterium ADurb.Bin314]
MAVEFPVDSLRKTGFGDRPFQPEKLREHFARVDVFRLPDHDGIVRFNGVEDETKESLDVERRASGVELLTIRQSDRPRKIREQIQFFRIKPVLELEPFAEPLREPGVGESADLFLERLQIAADRFFFLRGKTVLIDVRLVEGERVGADELPVRGRR